MPENTMVPQPGKNITSFDYIKKISIMMLYRYIVSQEASIGLPVLAPYLYVYIVGFPEEEIAFLVKKELFH